MNKTIRKIALILIIMIILIIGIVIGRYSERPLIVKKQPLYWIDPMEPAIHYTKPGKSRMNMDLVPVYPDEKKTDQSGIHISSSVINKLGIRVAPVTKGELSKSIETVGYVESDENYISHIHTYADGWIKKLVVKAVGDVIQKNQLIFQLYSPTLINAQEEYLIALDSNNASLIEASLKRLQSFHIAENQIQQLKKTRKPDQLVNIYSHQNGVVITLNVREGMHVTPDTEIMNIVDLSSIWIIAHIYEDQAQAIAVGETAEAKLTAYPGKIWKGKIEYIYPTVEPGTRTIKVRFRFDNPKGLLKPNMYAAISLLSSPKQNVLSIPVEALIRSSKGDHVIVSLGDGRFEVRSVTKGITSSDRIEILSGLKAGEQVVTSGQFLIDSEANLKASLQRLETHEKSHD